MSVKKLKTNSPEIKAFRKVALALLEKQHAKYIFKYRNLYKDFWHQYCTAYLVKPERLESDPNAKKRALQTLRHIKCRYAGRSEGGEIVTDNSILTHWSVKKKNEKTMTMGMAKRSKSLSETKKELDIVVTQTTEIDPETQTVVEVTEERGIEKRKISEIRFASEITIDTIKQIKSVTEFQHNFTKDYLYFLDGGTDEFEKLPNGKQRQRSGKNLSHLRKAEALVKTLEKISTDMLKEMDEGVFGPNDMKIYEQKLTIIKKTMDIAREIDLQPIKFVNEIAEGQFSQQKALQGAIINDKAMIDNGQIVLAKEEKTDEATPETLSKDLEDLGEAIMNFQLQNLNKGSESDKDDFLEGELDEGEEE